MRRRLTHHPLCYQLLRHSHGITVLGKLVGGEDVLQDVVPEVEAGTGFPLSGVLKELVEVVPVALKTLFIIQLRR